MYSFLDSFCEQLENMYSFETEILNQNEVKELLQDSPHNFPMICFEKTNDSDFDVDINESKFLNDEIYDNTWILIKEDDNIISLMSMNIEKEIVHLLSFEINTCNRKQGYSKCILEEFEKVIKSTNKEIHLTSFDTESTRFWEYMEYELNNEMIYVKKFI